MVQCSRTATTCNWQRKKISARNTLPEEFEVLKSRLSDFFHTKVQMTCSPKGKGKISIQFANEEDLERIMNALDNLKTDNQA